ncbi:MAG: hypothetical protein AAGN82_01065 [Myxococcota bacterium]
MRRGYGHRAWLRKLRAAAPSTRGGRVRASVAVAALAGLGLLDTTLGCDNRVLIETEGSSFSGSSGGGATGQPSGTTGSAGAQSPDERLVDLCALECGVPEEVGRVAHPEVTETSGLVVSQRYDDGVYYLHNDSGDEARFFAIDAEGRDLGTFFLEGVQAVDWEDATGAPCGARGGEACLYFGDIGDNPESRASVSVYRTGEPERLGPGVTDVLEAERFDFRYEDGPHDAEALVVNPSASRVLIIVKNAIGGARVYGAPLPERAGGPPGTLRPVAEFDLPTAGLALVTAAEAHRRDGVLVRTYTGVFFHPRPAGGTMVDALSQPGCVLPRPVEMQGEAIAPLPRQEGAGFVTIAEGAGAAINRVRCRP